MKNHKRMCSVSAILFTVLLSLTAPCLAQDSEGGGAENTPEPASSEGGESQPEEGGPAEEGGEEGAASGEAVSASGEFSPPTAEVAHEKTFPDLSKEEGQGGDTASEGEKLDYFPPPWTQLAMAQTPGAGKPSIEELLNNNLSDSALKQKLEDTGKTQKDLESKAEQLARGTMDRATMKAELAKAIEQREIEKYYEERARRPRNDTDIEQVKKDMERIRKDAASQAERGVGSQAETMIADYYRKEQAAASQRAEALERLARQRAADSYKGPSMSARTSAGPRPVEPRALAGKLGVGSLGVPGLAGKAIDNLPAAVTQALDPYRAAEHRMQMEDYLRRLRQWEADKKQFGK